MNPIKVPSSVKNDFSYQTIQLILELTKNLEDKFPIRDKDEAAYVQGLNAIKDVGQRHKAMLQAFAEVLVE